MKYGIMAGLLLLASSAQALETGEQLASWTLLDQFEQPYTLNDQLQVLLVAHDMPAAKLLNQALEGQPKGYLESRQAIFVADVSRMPALISSLFAVPAMRDYSYRVLLDHEPRVVPRYPVTDGKVLWLSLDRGRLVSSREFASAAELRQALEQAAQ